MADFPTALDEAMHGRYRLGRAAAEPKRPISHRHGLTARMNRIQAAVGGDRKAAAQAAGIPYSTWNHLFSGKRSASAANTRKLELAFARIVTLPAIAAKVKTKGYPVHYVVSAVTVADPGTADRKGSRYINGQRGGPANEQGWRPVKWKLGRNNSRDVVTAWLGHGAEAAAQAFVDRIRQEYRSEFGFEGDNVTVVLDGKQ